MKIETVGIIGLGYVGLPLAIEVLKTGKIVIGIDINESHLKAITSGIVSIEGVAADEVKAFIDSKKFVVASDFSLMKMCNIVVITVPTPLDEEQKPDLSMLRKACESVANYVSPDTLVINESTSFPGTLRNVIRPIFQQNSSEVYEKLEFGCSPERVDPGNKKYNFRNTPRNVSGLTENAKNATQAFYRSFVENVDIVASPEVAELAKLIENSYRLLNISFINELKKYCHFKSISLIEAIEAASTKPYGYSAFLPSAGVGGHCIPVDPVYLIEDAKKVGVDLKTLESANRANRSLSVDVMDVCTELLGTLENSKILIEGIAYKSNIADLRESAALAIYSLLEQKGSKVSWRDPIVKLWKTKETEKSSDEFDLVVVCVVHDSTDVKEIVSGARLVLDLTGRLPKAPNVVVF